jgi:hypothetical protein
LNRSTIAVSGLLALAVLTIYNLLLDSNGLKFSDIARFDRGIAEVRTSLPHAGTIGFYTDEPAGVNARQEYYLTQYAVAPVVLENNVDHELVIASVHSAESRINNPNLVLVRDFKNGIQLLRNKTK